MKAGELIYDLVLYNRVMKQLAISFLNSPLATTSIYNYFYKQHIRRKIERFKNYPFRVMLENTNICGADCVFCPHQKMKREKGIMDFNLSKEIIDQCKSIGIDYLTIYGFGEPLLDSHFYERVRYAKLKGISRVTTNTNAMYLNKAHIDEIFSSGLDEIYISFDAARPETYCKIRPNLDFYQVEDNILALVREKKKRALSRPIIILSFVETSFNQVEIPLYIRKWKGKVDHISFSLIHNWTGAIKVDQNIRVRKRDPCRLIWMEMVISWNGDVPLCCNDYENTIILGNIKNQSIKEIWSSSLIQRIRNWHLRKEFDRIPICKNCEYNYHYKSNWWVSK